MFCVKIEQAFELVIPVDARFVLAQDRVSYRLWLPGGMRAP